MPSIVKLINYTGMSIRLFDSSNYGINEYELCVYHGKRLVSRKTFTQLNNAQTEFLALQELAESDYLHCAYKIAHRLHDLLQGRK